MWCSAYFSGRHRLMPPSKKDDRGEFDALGDTPLKLRPRGRKRWLWIGIIPILAILLWFFLKPDVVPVEQQPQLIPVPKTQRVTTRPVELERRATDSLDMVYGRTYVIIGTFEYEANAEFVSQQHPGTRLYRFDEKWVVTAFETDSRTEAEAYVAGDTRYKEDFSPWVYTKK